MESSEIDRIKKKEQAFREADIPYGEHVAQSRNRWAQELELGSIVAALKPGRGASILDVGCADGRFLAYLDKKQHGRFLVGADFAVNPLKRHRALGLHTSPVAGDQSCLPFKAGSFGATVLLQVVQHLPTKTERCRALAELHRVMADRGRLAVTVVNRATWHDAVSNGVEGQLGDNANLFVFLYTPGELLADLAAAGFADIRITGISSLPGRIFNRLGFFGIPIDRAIALLWPWLALRKATYLLASCTKR